MHWNNWIPVVGLVLLSRFNMPRTCALRLAGFEPTSGFRRAQELLSRACVSHAPYEPPRQPSAQTVHQHRTATAWEIGWQGGDKLRFVDKAKGLSHPAHAADLALPQDLVDAVRFVVRRREGVVPWREARLQLLRDCAALVEDLRVAMVARMSKSVHFVCAGYNLALLAVIVNATHLPDVFLVRRFMYGFPVCGDLPVTGVFSDGGKRAEQLMPSVVNDSSNKRWNALLERSIVRRGRLAVADKDSVAWLAFQAVWDKTIAEVDGGWCVGPTPSPDGSRRGFSLLELNSHPMLKGSGSYRVIRRFGVEQKGSIRPVDNCTENGLNLVTGSGDKVTLIRPDSPARVCACFAREQLAWQEELQRQGRWEEEGGTAVDGVPDPYIHGNDDVKKAFRRIPNAAVGLMVVGVLNPLSLRAEFFVLPSFVFGSISAVMSWNRVPAAYTHFARRLLAVPSTAYVDDFQVGGPVYDQESSQASQSSMLDIIGLGFDSSKHEDGVQVSVNLGVESDFSLVNSRSPSVLLGVTDERKAKLAVVVAEILRDGVISHALALRLYGKARWTVCPVFGKIGLGVLHRLPSVTRTESVADGTLLGDDLRTLLKMLPMLRPVYFPLFARRDAPLLVWTDASEDNTLLGELGVVVWCPVRGCAFAAGSRAPQYMLDWLRNRQLKKKYITQWELFAVLVAFLTFPELFHFRLVHHFVDNKGALGGLIKGYSDKPDSARIINMVHAQAVRYSCFPWFGFVYSEDNIADGPSRGVFSDVEKLGAAVSQLVWPDLQVLAGWSVD